MRIVYLLNSLGISGGCVVLYNFAENLVKRGYEVYFVTPNECVKWRIGMKEIILKQSSVKGDKKVYTIKEVLKLILPKKVKNKISQSNFLFQHISLPKFTYNLVNTFTRNINRCDVLICTYWTTSFPGYFLADKVNKIFYHMQHYEEVFEPYSSFKRKFIRMTYFFPHILISNSTWLKKIIEKICQRTSYLLCPGIDLSIFYPSKNWGEKYKSKDRYYISSFVDANREFKGSIDLFETIRILNKELGEEKLLFKLYGFSLPSIFRDVKNIKFYGIIPHSNLQQFYSSSDIFIWASWCESFPLPPIEAMACGTNVVTTKFGTEDYAFDGYNSYVVLPRNPQALADKTLLLLRDLNKRKEMAKNALETVKKFSWEKQTEKLEQIFEEAPMPTISSRIESLVQDLMKGKNIEEIDKIIG